MNSSSHKADASSAKVVPAGISGRMSEILSGSKFAFFRQSGWMMIATTLSGFLFWSVHLFARRMPAAEYGLLGTVLQVVNLMGVPAIGLQTVFAQQAAAATDVERRKQLTSTLRAVLLWTFLLWFAMAVGIALFREKITSEYKVSNPTVIWVTVAIGLMQLWLPTMMGVLQGQQNFQWLGFTAILNGLGRLVVVAVMVLGFSAGAAGAAGGIFMGMVGAFALATWQGWGVLFGVSESFNWKPWLKRVLPLTCGLGATMFMLSADMIFVRRAFGEEQSGLYAAPGMIGRGLVFFTIPLAAVMFPKVVQSSAKSESTNVLAQAMGITALVGLCAAIGCTVLPELPIRLVQGAKYLPFAYLVPWFAWGMLPLTLAYVLINNLLARERFAVVPWMVLIAGGYGFALKYNATSFLKVVQTLGMANVVLFAVTAWFTWGYGKKRD